MAHQPNSIINDMANMLVAHGNKRNKDMVYPFNGMVAEPTQINIQKALDGKQEVSLPWLDSGKEGNLAIQSFEVHPVLGSAKHLYLFDRLHERNVKKEEETLHCVMNIKELKGKPNPQKDEKLHAPYNHDSRYLNQMKPINHIFLFRSNIDIPETHPPDQPHIFLKAFRNFASSLEIAFFSWSIMSSFAPFGFNPSDFCKRQDLFQGRIVKQFKKAFLGDFPTIHFKFSAAMFNLSMIRIQ